MGAGADYGIELFADLGGELLGIIEAAGNPLGIENDRGGDHRTGQRPAPGLVATRNRPGAALQGDAFAPEARTDLGFSKREADGHGGGLAGLGFATHGAMVRA